MSQGALLQRRHTCGSLKADMVIKPDKFIDHLPGLRPGLRFSPVNALAFQDGKEGFRHGVVVAWTNTAPPRRSGCRKCPLPTFDWVVVRIFTALLSVVHFLRFDAFAL